MKPESVHQRREEEPSLSSSIMYRVRFLSALLLVLSIILAWILSGRNWNAVAITITIVMSVIFSSERILSIYLGNELRIRESIKISILDLLFFSACLSFVYCIYFFIKLSSIDLENFYLLKYLIAYIMVSVVLLYSITVWRKYTGKYRQAREDLTRWLAELTFEGFTALYNRSGENNHENNEDSFKKCLQDIFNTTAYALKLNPVDNLIDCYCYWKRPYGTLSLWYMEPDIDPRNGFNITQYAAPEAPFEVTQAFQTIKENFHPARMDMDWYRQTVEHCTHDGVFDENGFRAQLNRNTHVSIAGYVFETLDTIPSASTSTGKDSILFDPSSINEIPDLIRQSISNKSKGWLDFKTFAAFPVFSPMDVRDTPRGVIVVFKNSPQGFMAEDRIVLSIASRLLGILCTRASQVEEGEGSERGGQGGDGCSVRLD